jgi:competence protein ComEC
MSRSLVLVAALVASCDAVSAPGIAPVVATQHVSGPAMRVHAINIGQGAATLVEFSCAAMLIDTGGEDNEHFSSTKHLQQYLDGFFASRPDLHRTLALLVLTHPHADHTHNAMMVWSTYHVANVVTDGLRDSSGGADQGALIDAATKAGVGIRAIAAKDIPADGLTDDVIDPIKCPDGDPDIRVLWGAVDKADVSWTAAVANRNNHSVVTKVTLGKSSILVTGDLEEEGIGSLLAKYAATPDVLRADAIKPKLAIIAMGSERRRYAQYSAWQFGHPRATTIGLLEQALTGEPRVQVNIRVANSPRSFELHPLTAPIYATGWDGNIALTLGADGTYEVATQGGR